MMNTIIQLVYPAKMEIELFQGYILIILVSDENRNNEKSTNKEDQVYFDGCDVKGRVFISNSVKSQYPKKLHSNLCPFNKNKTYWIYM